MKSDDVGKKKDHLMRMELLEQERFKNAWCICANDASDACAAQACEIHAFLLEQYESVGRFYHTLNHIQQCLTQLDAAIPKAALTEEAVAKVEVAIWFHDAIYEPGSSQNEALSAELFEKKAESFSNKEVVRDISRSIVETNHRHSPSSELSKWVVDLDLSGMGLSNEKFQNDGEFVRKELTHLSDQEYVDSQIKFFKGLLARERIYHTDYFYNQYEQPARQNIQTQLRIYSDTAQ